MRGRGSLHHVRFRDEYIDELRDDIVANKGAKAYDIDKRLERLMNTSSIKDDVMDRWDYKPDPLAEDPVAVDRWLKNSTSHVEGWEFVSMVLDEEFDVWTVVARSPDRQARVEASHASLAKAKCLACIEMVKHSYAAIMAEKATSKDAVSGEVASNEAAPAPEDDHPVSGPTP